MSRIHTMTAPLPTLICQQTRKHADISRGLLPSGGIRVVRKYAGTFPAELSVGEGRFFTGASAAKTAKTC